MFRVDNRDVRSLLGLEGGPRDRFSFNQILADGLTLMEQATLASRVQPRQRNLYQQHLLELFGQVSLYDELQAALRPYSVPPTTQEEQWRPLAVALADIHASGRLDKPAADLAEILRAYSDQDAVAFNQRVTRYLAWFNEAMPDTARKAGLEVFFNRFQPFYQGTILYVITFLLACSALLLSTSERSAWARRLGVAAVSLLAVTLVLHTFGLGARMYLQGRPPVTNLYSSAIFIGWVCVILGLIIELLYRNRLGVLLAALIGFVTLIIAHNLAAGDTMELMQAVLDTNFWLATHVVTVTIGYSATFLAGFIGIAYILTGVYTRALSTDRAKTLYKMMYGVIAFALLFSFVGTVLGGIWADQSWGRFWGWDPKENGAVLIVLMNALILHARWGGMIQARGMAVLAVVGNIITSWSWFGTNMLGVGLHSYGRMDPALFWLMVFIVSQLSIISVGLLPQHRWASTTASSTTSRAKKHEATDPPILPT